jgi:Zn-dependent oligopeptidase
VIRKRHELTKVLNYTSFADYTMRELMAKNASTVEAFLDNLARKLIPRARKEILRI